MVSYTKPAAQLLLSIVTLGLIVLSIVNAGIATWNYNGGEPWEFDAFQAVYLWLVSIAGARLTLASAAS